MAIQWGAWASGGGIRSRLGLNFTNLATGAPVRCEVWLETTGWVTDNYNTLTVSGSHSFSGSVPISMNGAGRVKLRTVEANHPAQYGSDRTGTASVSLAGFTGGAPTCRASWRVKAKPYLPANMPTNIGGARLDDGQARVKWEATMTSASGARPTSTFTIQRKSKRAPSWRTVGTVGWRDREFIDKGITPDDAFTWRVRANGAGGSSSWNASGTVYTSPAAPGNLEASRSVGDIILEWVNLSLEPSTVEIWEDDARIASVKAGTTTYRVAGPDPSSPHVYKLRAVAHGLTSPFTESEPVQVVAAPYAPTDLVPNGEWRPADAVQPVSWRHNTRDGSGQGKRQFSFRKLNHPTWSIQGSVASSEEAAAMQWGMHFTEPGIYEWRVRTWGQDPNKESPWSAPAILKIVEPPTASIIPPSPADSSELEVRISSPSGAKAWEAENAIIGRIVDRGSGTGPGPWVWTLGGLENGRTYYARARTYDKVWSPWVQTSFRVSYAAPQRPTLTGFYAPEAGTITITPSPDPDAPASTAETVAYRIDRLTEGEWLKIGTVEPGATFIDQTPLLQAEGWTYRAVAISALPSETVSEPVVIPVSGGLDAFLNWGTGWQNFARLRYNLQHTSSDGLTYRAMPTFAGQVEPTIIEGKARQRSLSLTGTILPYWIDAGGDEVIALLREAASTPGIKRLRLPEGIQIDGAMTDLTIVRVSTGARDFAFTIKEGN